MKKAFISILFLVLLVLSCNKKKVIDKSNEENNSNLQITGRAFPNENISELEKLIMETGDSIAYYKLSSIYLDLDILLPYSLHMADKYNDSYACYMVYLYFIIHEYPKNKNKKTLHQAISYLIKSMQLGHWQARHELGNLYINGEFVEKNVELGNYILDGGNDIEGFVEKQRIYTGK